MPKITEKKTEDIFRYRRNYYQDNKERISKYQKEQYLIKKGLPLNYKLNWRGEKRIKTDIIKGYYTINFD
tara:strand:- start:2635 stop:2844 length:210 start_codon:yes stop_codon:yes gene_type:complete